MKYRFEELQDALNGKTTLKEIANKYQTSTSNVRRAMNRQGLFTCKKRILIKTPYKTTIANSMYECANTLQISYTSVRNALKGKKIKILEELDITLEVYYGEKK